jgi:protein-L-isoaspartate(D-aspartate) O-methyltransferase
VASLQLNGFISSPDVAAAFLRLDRAVFATDPAIPPPTAPYSNAPVRIAFSETMTSPAMHARCLQTLYSTGLLTRGATCADVGTGSGFVAAALALLSGSSGRVVAIDRIECARLLPNISIRCHSRVF